VTKDEADKLTSFKNLCNCGGYARSMNGRPENQPHMAWCPQYREYAEWYEAKHSTPTPEGGG
jgi:hypothetical protein